MISRLDRYVSGMFLSSWVVSVVLFLGLYGVVDFFSHVEEMLKHAAGAGEGVALIGRFYLYQAPSILLMVAPFVMLMAALFTVMRLQRHGELMAMLMTGRSARRVLLPLFALTTVFVGLIVAVQEGLAPRCAKERDRLEAQLLHANRDWVIEGQPMRDAQDHLVSPRNYHVGTGVIEKLYVSWRDEKGRNVSLEGTDAIWDEPARGWRFRNGRTEIRDLAAGGEPIVDSAAFYPTDLRPEDLIAEHLQPFDLSYREVLERSDRYPHIARYRLLRHYHVTSPLSVLLLVLLGIPFVLKRQPKSHFTGVGVSILICFAYLLVDVTARDFGMRGFLAPVLAAWLPVILAGSLGVVLFDTVET